VVAQFWSLYAFIYLFILENNMSQELYQISIPKCQCIRTAENLTTKSCHVLKRVLQIIYVFMRNICTHFIYCDCVSLSTLHCAGPRSTTCSLYTVSLLFIQETNARLLLRCLAAGSADWHETAVLWSFTELFRAGYAEPCYINS